MTGSRNTASGVGPVTLITPIRITSGLGLHLPGVITQVLTFVPEQGSLLLFGMAAGFAIIGRKRMRE